MCFHQQSVNMTPETESKPNETVKHSRCFKEQTGLEKLEKIQSDATNELRA